MRNLIYLAVTIALVTISMSLHGLGGSCHTHEGTLFHCHE